MIEEVRIKDEFFSRSQALSIGLHLSVIGLLLIPFAAHLNVRFPPPNAWFLPGPPPTQPSLKFLQQIAGGKTGSGGQRESLPARRGSMRFTAIPVMPIRRITNPDASLQMPPAVSGPEFEIRVTDQLGVPWSKYNNDSFGPGGDEGAGNGRNGRTVGDRTGDGYSQFDHKGEPGYIQPSCQYCPNPTFTEEAVKAKFQGRVLLRVLVSAEGKADRVQVVAGAGMGLDERARDAVLGWRFRPGRDPAGTPTATSIYIEVYFRQF